MTEKQRLFNQYLSNLKRLEVSKKRLDALIRKDSSKYEPIIITQYYPNYFTGFTSQMAHITSIDQLLELEWMKRFIDNNFHQFSLAYEADENGVSLSGQYNILAECDNGERWHVAAYCNHHYPRLLIDNLPKFEKRPK